MSYPFNIRSIPPLTAVANGVALSTGDTLTGADVHDLIIDNGVIKLTTEEVSGQKGASFLWRYVNGTAIRASSAEYGDRMYYQTSIATSATSITIVKKTADVVVFDMKWTTFALSPGGALIDKDYGYGYAESSSTIKRNSSVTLYKRVRVERDAEGYFVGYRTTPWNGPHWRDLPGAYTNDNSWGEREISCDGGNSAVTFSSNGMTARHPAWGAAASWTAPVVTAVGGNRVAWMNIDDPTYAPWNDSPTAGVIATQTSGFPIEQTTGDVWVASIHYDTTNSPLVRYMVTDRRWEIGAWQESAVARGTTVLHFLHDTGEPYQVFIGAFNYAADSSSNFANEPTSGLRTTMAAKAAAVDWPVA